MEKKWAVKSVLALATTLLMSGTVINSVQAAKFPIEYDNHKKPVKGGTLRVGTVGDEAFKGVFADILRSDGPTSDVAQFGEYNLFKVNDDYTYAKGGLAEASIDYGNKTVTVKLKKNAGWSDGHPLEAKDLEYTYEVAANSAANSASYNAQLRTIEGIEEYHDGKADKISGLEVKDKKTLVIHFKEFEPEIKFPNAGYVLSTAMPYHYLKDVPFDKLASSDKLQKHPLFYGPFKIKNIVRGESIE